MNGVGRGGEGGGDGGAGGDEQGLAGGHDDLRGKSIKGNAGIFVLLQQKQKQQQQQQQQGSDGCKKWLIDTILGQQQKQISTANAAGGQQN